MCVGVRGATLDRRHWNRDLKEEEVPHKIRGTSLPSGGNSPRTKALSPEDSPAANVTSRHVVGEGPGAIP